MASLVRLNAFIPQWAIYCPKQYLLTAILLFTAANHAAKLGLQRDTGLE